MKNLNSEKSYTLELRGIQSTTGLAPSTSNGRRLQSAETTSLFALGMGRSTALATRQEPVRQAKYAHSEAGLFRVVPSLPQLGVYSGASGDTILFGFWSFFAFILFLPQMVHDLCWRVVPLLCETTYFGAWFELDKKRSTRWSAIPWAISAVLFVVTMILYSVCLAGDFTAVNPSDLLLLFGFWLMSICVAAFSQAILLWRSTRAVKHADYVGRAVEHADVATIVIFACKRKHELEKLHVNDLKIICAVDSVLLAIFFGACPAIAFSIATADRYDYDGLNLFCFIALCLLAAGRVWQACVELEVRRFCCSPPKSEPATDTKDDPVDGKRLGFSSPFGCAKRKASRVPTGAVGLKTAGVARPARRFNFV